MSILYTTVPSANRKRLALSVRPDGKVIVKSPKAFPLQAVERFVETHIHWINKRIEFYKKIPDKIILDISHASVPDLKKKARILAESRLVHFNQHYQFAYKKISIRSQKTRWGSASKSGTLSFNYKIALLLPELADYIIVHELCHIGQMNHSIYFWNLVAETVPNHKEMRKKLKKVFEI